MLPAEGLAWGREILSRCGVPTADLEAQLLLAHCLGVERSGLFACGNTPLKEVQARAFRRLVGERGRRTPLAFVLGTREFWSRDFNVDARVLIPRPETEGIVEAASELLAPEARVADIGTGSGNIIIALAGELKGSDWYAVDVSSQALQVAGENLRRHGLEHRIELACSDLLSFFDSSRHTFDAIVANPPYIPTDEIDRLEPEVRRHEPRLALDGGRDGLRLIRRLVDEAPPYLRPGGFLIMEVGAGQAPTVERILEERGAFRAMDTRRDLAGIERIVIARRMNTWKA